MTATPMPLTWAILGTANIARAQLLPALAEAGGRPAVVAGRHGDRAQSWAAAHGVERGVEGYRSALDDDEVDAVYVALPNTLHAEWTIAALEAGKAVLCEKPLCTSVEQTQLVLDAARRTDGLLWEAFVFPLGSQFARLRALLDDGVIGDLREVESSFHFRVRDPDNIRLAAAMGGGCLADVGTYPMRLAQLLFGAATERVQVSAIRGAEVEVDASALLDYPAGRRLALTCGFERAYDTTTRLLGTDGVITLTNPFHPGPDDTMAFTGAGGNQIVERAMTDRRSFSGAIRHITAAVRGVESPRHLAVTDSLDTARSLQMAQALA